MTLYYKDCFSIRHNLRSHFQSMCSIYIICGQNEVHCLPRMKHLTINTHCGLYHHIRLPFGLASALAIFQCTIKTLLDLPMVVVYIDNILVAERLQDKHLANLAQVLQWLEDAGLRLKKVKCSLCLSELGHLGNLIWQNLTTIFPPATNIIVRIPIFRSLRDNIGHYHSIY